MMQLLTITIIIICSAFDADRERQHQALERQLKVTSPEACRMNACFD